ncbi:hypothetical protein Pst134EA_033173 [Puccinia striiformis f. sp. tritici]|uniref:hypothetical protein n=1 Tax=Puccinia striiformis f. sp. tritici TaxID=168172 RepID=UPI002007CEFC|nr:hypothetical protein Pst134EA_033173 [Puccinia striiformis f. sp. tritici]KAH9448923.1 hypothetical protein Pst134EA_033173 [Puccinia striiformis f. sp. tritici]
MNQMSLDKWSKSGTCQPKVKLNGETLKSAIVYMVAQCDLSFATVEKKSFREFAYLLNEDATPMIDSINQTSIATHIARMHHQSENTIKTNYISKQISISFTQDAWTAPNFTAFMAVTAHFIDEKFVMRNLTLAVPQVEGNHSGKFFAELFYNVLEKYSAINVMHTITADNASVNNKMARELDLQIPHFSSATHILGCVAHVINLAAKLGVAALGSTDNNNDGDEISMASLDSESNTGAGINTRTIIKRVHGMCTWVRFSPQRRERFAVAVHSCQPELHAKKIRGFEIDVSTRWNSTFLMFQRAILLEKSYTHFCQQNKEVAGFILSTAEWNQARTMMKFLGPLSEATELLCASEYPTLNNALPVYIVLSQHLKSARQGLDDQLLLVQPADQMVEKINTYLNSALQKPVYVCAMILDPRFKISFWKNNENFIIDHYDISAEDILKTFKDTAEEFYKNLTKDKQKEPDQQAPPPVPKAKNFFALALYQPPPEMNGIQEEIDRYLKEDIEPEGIEVLSYWAHRQKTLPNLAMMVRQYLSIPATSAASKRVFSKGRRVVSWQ